MLKTLQPVIVPNLYLEIHQELILLLKNLTPDDWRKPTICQNWPVKDVALHLLGGDIGNLSRRRDGHIPSASINSWDELVQFVNDWNEKWGFAADRISPV
ncbi:MAG: maleylpyruvate isomerase N-terminal domain-containing protein [Anaerolineaceae bacterium]|nr:maleylpyruvate isomerase N-terminal domain-containing protein [Anaerolineaceae bacterium]